MLRTDMVRTRRVMAGIRVVLSERMQRTFDIMPTPHAAFFKQEHGFIDSDGYSSEGLGNNEEAFDVLSRFK